MAVRTTGWDGRIVGMMRWATPRVGSRGGGTHARPADTGLSHRASWPSARYQADHRARMSSGNSSCRHAHVHAKHASQVIELSWCAASPCRASELPPLTRPCHAHAHAAAPELHRAPHRACACPPPPPPVRAHTHPPVAPRCCQSASSASSRPSACPAVCACATRRPRSTSR
jgi:hypothetical protein